MLWLATAIVHHANRVRENRSGVKVGGHQASSASMVSLMTAEAVDEMNLKVGDEAVCVVKATNVIVEVPARKESRG